MYVSVRVCVQERETERKRKRQEGTSGRSKIAIYGNRR